MCRSCCPTKNTWICILCGVLQQYCHCRCWIISATISSTTNLRSTYIHLCSTVPARKNLLPSSNGRAERQVQRSLEEGGNIIDMVQGSPRTSTPRVSARLNVPRKKVSRKLLNTEGLYPYHIQRIQQLVPAGMVSWLASCTVSNANPQKFRNILFSGEVHFTHDQVNKTRKFHLLNHDNPHKTVRSTDLPWRCFVVSFVTSSLDRTSAYVREVIFTPVFAKLSYLTFLYQHLPALMSIPSFQSDHHTESESAVL